MTCQSPEGFRVYNVSGESLTIQITGVTFDDEPPVVGTGRLLDTLVIDGCEGTGAIARAEDGSEVARLDQPVCDGQVWIIEEDGDRLED